MGPVTLKWKTLCSTGAEFLFLSVIFSFWIIHAWTFISLQIKEFQIMGLSINDSVYSCVFFFLTGLHFFHLLLGLLLLILLFWSCSFSFQNSFIIFFLSVVWRFFQEIIFSPATTIKGREVSYDPQIFEFLFLIFCITEQIRQSFGIACLYFPFPTSGMLVF